jgi:hypothetical protein
VGKVVLAAIEILACDACIFFMRCKFEQMVCAGSKTFHRRAIQMTYHRCVHVTAGVHRVGGDALVSQLFSQVPGEPRFSHSGAAISFFARIILLELQIVEALFQSRLVAALFGQILQPLRMA